MTRWLMTALLIPALAAPAFAGTPLETFQKKVQKFATTPDLEPEKAKRVCHCLQSTQPGLNGRMGVLGSTFQVEFGGELRVGQSCNVPGFDPTTGDVTSLATCEDWELVH